MDGKARRKKTNREIGVFQSYNPLAASAGFINSSAFLASMLLFIFAVPFFVPGAQLVTGTIVNATLIVGAVLLKGEKPYYLVFLPAVAQIASGLLFGPFSIFLVYLLPFIWLGNAVLVYAFKEYHAERKINFFAVLAGSAALKAVLIFGFAMLLSNFGLVPQAILSAMGALQLVTAVAGGVLAYFALLSLKRIYGI
ncbi:MAG TPA: hypothetical protein PLO51_06320 [Candidatus Micrarchaeota archaeon]|nr:hypothetical protein [Candidatus Micrarchaeota archaeon]